MCIKGAAYHSTGHQWDNHTSASNSAEKPRQVQWPRVPKGENFYCKVAQLVPEVSLCLREENCPLWPSPGLQRKKNGMGCLEEAWGGSQPGNHLQCAKYYKKLEEL